MRAYLAFHMMTMSTTISLTAIAAALLAPAASSQTWKAPVFATHWAAATGHPLASMAAARIFQQGGNAVDAAVAATFVASVVQPGNTGIGGHGMVMIYLARTGQVYCMHRWLWLVGQKCHALPVRSDTGRITR
ncbi:MAG: hypothetical protein FJW30_20970 [Acidobacteria bacterium]|nr:hypothetical protein [Acidobacteriota bacterium]